MGWDHGAALGWSHLCMVSRGDTWFRDRRVYGFFDRLIDDGFFEDFEQVIFYGAGRAAMPPPPSQSRRPARRDR